MKKIFAAPHQTSVYAVRGFLASKGIVTRVIGEEGPVLAGAVPMTECFVELHVCDDQDEQRALKLVQEFLTARPGSGRTWTCPTCGEEMGPKFTDCWKCTKAPAVKLSTVMFGAFLLIMGGMVLFFSWPAILRCAKGGKHPPSWSVAVEASMSIAAAVLLFIKGCALGLGRSGKAPKENGEPNNDKGH